MSQITIEHEKHNSRVLGQLVGRHSVLCLIIAHIYLHIRLTAKTGPSFEINCLCCKLDFMATKMYTIPTILPYTLYIPRKLQQRRIYLSQRLLLARNGNVKQNVWENFDAFRSKCQGTSDPNNLLHISLLALCIFGTKKPSLLSEFLSIRL